MGGKKFSTDLNFNSGIEIHFLGSNKHDQGEDPTKGLTYEVPPSNKTHI